MPRPPEVSAGDVQSLPPLPRAFFQGAPNEAADDAEWGEDRYLESSLFHVGLDEDAIEVMAHAAPRVRWVLLDAVDPERLEGKGNPSAWLNRRVANLFKRAGYLPVDSLPAGGAYRSRDCPARPLRRWEA